MARNGIKVNREYIYNLLVTTRLTNEYLIWERGGSPASGFPFTVKMTINYPTQTLTYHPGFWQVINRSISRIIYLYNK